jgi:hypothetical protein
MVLATINYKIDEEYTQNCSFKLKSVGSRVVCTIYSSIYNPVEVLKLKTEYNLEFDTIRLIRKVSSALPLDSIKADSAKLANQNMESQRAFGEPRPSQTQNILVPVPHGTYSGQSSSLFAFNNVPNNYNVRPVSSFDGIPNGYVQQVQSPIPKMIDSPPVQTSGNSMTNMILNNQTLPNQNRLDVKKLNAYTQQLLIHIKENSNGVPDFNSETSKNISKSRNFIKNVLNVNLKDDEYQYIISKLRQT